MKLSVESGFEAITQQLNDVQARGSQIIDEHANSQTPFGAELLTETPDAALRLGSLACVRSKDTTVDDTPIIGTTGSDNNAGIPVFDEPPREISSLN